MKSRWSVSLHVYLVSGCWKPYVVKTLRWDRFLIIEDRQSYAQKRVIIGIQALILRFQNSNGLFFLLFCVTDFLGLI